LFTTRLVRYWRESSVCPLLPMRIPISSPSKSTSRQPSVVLYLEVMVTSPRSMEANTSFRNTSALSSISLISSGSVMISIAFAALTVFSFAGFSFCSLTGFSLEAFSLNCFSLTGFGCLSSFAFSPPDSFLVSGVLETDFTAGFCTSFAVSSLSASILTESMIFSISFSSELSSTLRALMIAGLLPIPKNPELPSLTT